MTSPPSEDRTQQGCLLIWLILLLVALGLGSIAYFYIGVVLSSQGSGQEGGLSILLAIVFSIGAAGASSLLAKRKFGFYFLVFSFLGASVLQLVAATRIDMVVLGILNVAILWWLVRPQWASLQ